MKVNLKTTNEENAAATSTCHQRGQRTVNGVIGNTRRGIVIDKTLDPDSNNPVANKPVSTALAALAGKIDAALQKPTGLTKTKLVGVGAQGQENIEIGDNLTLANGKLSAMGGGGSVNILTGSEPDQVDNTIQGAYSGVPDDSKINILHIPDFGYFVITYITDGIYTSYVDVGDAKASIILSEGQYTLILGSGLSGASINTITVGNNSDTFSGTINSKDLTVFYYRVPGQNYYMVLPISSLGNYGTCISVNDDNGDMTVFSFLESTKTYTTKIYHLKYHSHFITMTDSANNAVLYLTIRNTYARAYDNYNLQVYLAGKKVLANGNLHGVIPTYIAGEGGVIKVYYMTPGDSNINPTPDEYQDLYSFTITDLVSPVE